VTKIVAEITYSAAGTGDKSARGIQFVEFEKAASNVEGLPL
jgi:hypothetical protein